MWWEARQRNNANKKAEAAQAAARLARERAEAARVAAAKQAEEEAKSCWIVRALRGLFSLLFWLIIFGYMRVNDLRGSYFYHPRI